MDKFLGLDLGTNSLGIARSDFLGIVHGVENFNFEHGNYKKARERILEIVELSQIYNVVLGLPLMINGKEETRSISTRKFAEDLIKANPKIKIFYQDERYTTIEAKERMIEMGLKKAKQEALIDMFSAIIILESYLNKINRG